MLPSSETRTWWLAGGVAALVLGAILLLVSVRRTPVALSTKVSSPAVATNVGLTRLVHAGGDNLVAEEAKFFDPTPLFLPTEWNADQKALPSSALGDAGQMFKDFPSKVFFQANGLNLSFPPTVHIPPRPGDALTMLDDDAPYLGFGRGQDAVPVLGARGAYVEVVAVATGRRVLAEGLPEAQPPSGNWRPFEFLAVINSAGLVGRLSYVNRSGMDEVDAYFQNYLVKSLNLGDVLRPGFYRICIGP